MTYQNPTLIQLSGSDNYQFIESDFLIENCGNLHNFRVFVDVDSSGKYVQKVTDASGMFFNTNEDATFYVYDSANLPKVVSLNPKYESSFFHQNFQHISSPFDLLQGAILTIVISTLFQNTNTNIDFTKQFIRQNNNYLKEPISNMNLFENIIEKTLYSFNTKSYNSDEVEYWEPKVEFIKENEDDYVSPINNENIYIYYTLSVAITSITSEYSSTLTALSNTGESSSKIRHLPINFILSWYFVNQLERWHLLGSDIDGEAPFDRSGFSVSLNYDGKIVAIGATGNDANNLSNSGHVRVYQYIDYNWVQLGIDIDGEAAGDQSGISVSLNYNGNIVAIGATNNDANGKIDSGHVRVFEYIDSSGWFQLGNDIDGEASHDRSGISVSLNGDGNIVAIGAHLNDASNGINNGHVRVYRYTNQKWEQIGEDIDGYMNYDWFGMSLCLNRDGNIIVIGALLSDANGRDSGLVSVYQYDSSGNMWVQQGNSISGSNKSDLSGISVSMNDNGSRIAIGAPLHDYNGQLNIGQVRVFEYINSSGWFQLGNDIYGENVGDRSGFAVSLDGSGNNVAIGAYYNMGKNGIASGHVRVYNYDITELSWKQVGIDVDGHTKADKSGYSVSLSKLGNKVAIGAPFNDDAGTDSGHVCIYEYI